MTRIWYILILMLILPMSAHSKVPSSRGEIQLSFAPVVKQVTPAVVNIYTQRLVQERIASPLFRDPFFNQFFGNDPFFGGRERTRIENSLGSGVIVDESGLIVTNEHVIEGADEIRIVLSDRREFEASVVTSDKRTDLAVLKIDSQGEKLPTLTLRDSDQIEVGDLVLAIGNPFGVGQTVTSGIISAQARTSVGISDYNFFIQTDAAINPGNSGGALVTMDGKLIGINTAIYSKSGGSMGIGFAIPSNLVGAVIEAVAHGGPIVRPWMGLSSQSISPDLAEALGLDRPGGVLVSKLHPASPLTIAGLQVGDVITTLAGHELYDPDELKFRIGTLRVGDTTKLGVIRKGKKLTLTVPLITAPEKPPRDQTLLTGRHPLAGAVVVNISPAVVEELENITVTQGVAVIETKPGSTANRIGLRPGDVIHRINGEDIKNVKQLNNMLKKSPQRRWHLGIQRGDRMINTVIGG